MSQLMLQKRRERLIQTTLELLRISSVTGDEAEICRWVELRGWQLQPGWTCHRLGHTVVFWDPDPQDRPTLALFGHLDTVKPAADQPLGVEADRIFGCGASDMKGGLAVMLELMAEAHTFTRARPVLVFYDREEGPLEESGILPLLESRILPPIDLSLCLEPTDNRLQPGCVGSLHARVRVQGRRAHSARPWQGENAVTNALPVLERVAALSPRAVEVQGLTFFEVTSVTQMNTENGRNVIPDQVVLNINHRFAPGRSSEAAAAWLREAVLGPGQDPHCQLEILDSAPSGAVCLDEPMLSRWRLDHAIPVEAKQAWTDVARLTARGIPAANFGPGETAQAHQARESASIAGLVEGHRLLRLLFRPG